jgi:lipopolysaccharide/colanic/teichoic acid biosynthesis glycosyltransferase
METLKPTPIRIPERGWVGEIDRYLRRPDTALATLSNSVFPYKGEDYLNSKCKRLLDLSVAVPAAVVSTPVVTFLGVAKKLEDGGSAFFIQERLDHNPGKTINLVKIRCMKPDSDMGLGNFQIARGLRPSEDPRNTRLGAFMRRWQLEELPQLFQVLQGKLSIMGIRPVTQSGSENLRGIWSGERFNKWVNAYQKGILGTSGLCQTLGSYLKEDEKRFHLDVFYTRHANLGLDLYLLWRTAVKLIRVS